MSHTRDKFSEAAFFHSKFVEHITLQPPLKPEVGFYLNAFVTSARSVLWIMRWEYSQVPGWESWFKGGEQGLSDEEKSLLQRFTALRNQSQKRKQIAPELLPMLVANLVPVSSLPVNPFGDSLPPGPGTWYTMSYSPPAGVIWLTVVQQQEIRASCEHYLGFLGRVVGECENQFGVPTTSPTE